MKRVLLGMSGGVDSSVSALLLQKQGYQVVGVTMRLFDDAPDPSIDAKKMCDFLNIEHHIADFRETFKNCVIDNFIENYSCQMTPNPCIQCNKHLKFGLLWKMAKSLNCDYIATGHYAKIEFSDKYNSLVLRKSHSRKKDQSYVLYTMDKTLLDKVLFPLGEFNSKDEIRAIANEHGLPVASKPDSEDICFIPDGNYIGFLEKHSHLKANSGDIVFHGNVVGTHSGLYRYTIGQRKGIGVTHSKPLYVIGFDGKKNQLIVGEEGDLYDKEMCVGFLNFLVDIDFSKPLQLDVVVRYQSSTHPAKINVENGEAKVQFANPVARITPGQSAVFYDGDIVVGGGIILK